LITVTENLKAQQAALKKKLKSRETTMKTFATKTLVSSMDEALTGKAADAADTYLTDTVKKPDFDNPIQGV
jgi:hypothetical protein